MKLVGASLVLVVGLVACGHSDGPAPETQSTATATSASTTTATPPDCGERDDGDPPCKAPPAAALPARGAKCFSNQVMMGRMMCDSSEHTCEELREAARRLLASQGNSAEDIKGAIGTCVSTYWCAAGVVDGKSQTACFAEREACVSNRDVMLGPEASGCVRAGASGATADPY